MKTHLSLRVRAHRMMFAYLIKYSIIFDTWLIYLISFHWINRKGIALGFIDLYCLCAIVGIMQMYVASRINEFMSFAVFCLKNFAAEKTENHRILFDYSLAPHSNPKCNRKKMKQKRFPLNFEFRKRQKLLSTSPLVLVSATLLIEKRAWKKEHRESCSSLSRFPKYL